MGYKIIAALAIGLGSTPALAATVQPEDVLGSSFGGFDAGVTQVTFNIIQQISIPITINQAIAVAINSQNVFANAETTVVSINETVSYFVDFGAAPNFGQPLDLSSLNSILNDYLATLWVPSPDLGIPGLVDGDMPAAVPLPAALPMSFAGLAALGALGWRRRRSTPSSTLA